MKTSIKILLSIAIVLGLSLMGFFIWQATIKVPTQADWQKALAIQSTAEFNGDLVTVKNVRNFRYNESEREEDLVPAYYDKTYDLNNVKKVWFIVEPFKDLKFAAHTFVSFEFSDGTYLSISIEARKQKGQVYNLFKGMLHTYPLIYIATDERDAIMMRANVRKSQVYVYPVNVPDQKYAKILLTDMLKRMNEIVDHPTWYHTLWANCTSSIARHVNAIQPGRLGFFPWQLWATGYADKLAFKVGLIDTNLSLEEAKKKFNVTEKSQKIGDVEDYSIMIRQ